MQVTRNMWLKRKNRPYGNIKQNVKPLQTKRIYLAKGNIFLKGNIKLKGYILLKKAIKLKGNIRPKKNNMPTRILG